jgi:hypothetical protein
LVTPTPSGVVEVEVEIQIEVTGKFKEKIPGKKDRKKKKNVFSFS